MNMKELLINLMTKVWHRASLSYTTNTGRPLTTLPRVITGDVFHSITMVIMALKKPKLFQHFPEE